LEEERKQHEFHANPCPKFSYSSVPEKPTLIATRPAPFQLSCDTRGKSKHEKFIQQVCTVCNLLYFINYWFVKKKSLKNK